MHFDYRRIEDVPTLLISVDGYEAAIILPEEIGEEIERKGGRLLAQAVPQKCHEAVGFSSGSFTRCSKPTTHASGKCETHRE